MDSETLERLLMDRALGQLPPDTEALLAAWLADQPAAQALSERIQETVAVATSTLTPTASLQIPPFPADVIHRLHPKGRPPSGWRTAGKAASLAACVLLGFGLHAAWRADAPQIKERPGSITIVHNAPAPSAGQANAESQEPGFWSAKRWEEQAKQRRPERGKRVIWDSPLSTPRLGDTT